VSEILKANSPKLIAEKKKDNDYSSLTYWKKFLKEKTTDAAMYQKLIGVKTYQRRK